jgi:RHS repeat-associated protein
VRRLIILVIALAAAPRIALAQQAETVEYYGHDVIGSIRITWDANGNVVGRKDYEPFGRVVFPAPAMDIEGFGAQEQDDETTLSYFHARMFQSGTGRFTRPDPIMAGLFTPQGWNRYAYALNRPLTQTDFSGLCPAALCFEDVVTVIGHDPGGGGGGNPDDTIGALPDDERESGGGGGTLPGEPPGGEPNSSPSPGPNPGPGPNPPPGPPPTPPRETPPFLKFVDRVRCAADVSDTISIAAFTHTDDSFWGNVALGNDVSAFARYLANADMSAGVGLIINNPSNYSVAARVGKVALQAKVTAEQLIVRETPGGTPYVSAVSGGKLGNTMAGKVAARAVGAFSVIKGAYDLGTFVGSFVFACGR